MRKLVWFTLGFAGACFVSAYFYSKMLVWLAGISCLLCCACFVVYKRNRIFHILAVIFLGLSIGFSCFYVFDRLYLQRVRSMDGQTAKMLIIADDYSWDTAYGCAFEGTTYVAEVPYRIRVYLNDPRQVSPGDLIEGNFRLRFTADGGDDVAPQYRGKGVFLVASQQDDGRYWDGVYFRWYHHLSVWRMRLNNLLAQVFPEGVSGFATGLLLGDRTGLNYETETAFKISGIMHIIAVSGLHVSILFSLIYLISGRQRYITAIIGIPIVLLFAAVAGFTPSVTRASLMQVLMMLAMLFNKEYDPPTALAFAVLSMLAVNPLTVSSVSFQLSTACMVGIFSFSGKIRDWLMDAKRLGKWKGKRMRAGIASWFSGSVSMTLGAMVYTVPLCAYYFGMVSIVGILTNLLTLWVVSFVFYGIMAVCAIGVAVPAVAALLASGLALPIRYVFAVTKTLAAFPFSAVYTRNVYMIIWLVLCYLLLVLGLVWKQKRILEICSVLVVALLVIQAISWVEPTMDSYRVTVLDVGQGQCILIQSEGRTFMVDCGGDDEELAADAAAETLLAQGITKLDGLILTHYDSDHAGGVPYLLQRVDTQLLYVPHILDAEKVTEQISLQTSAVISTVKEDTVLSFGNSRLTLYAPETYNSKNESSMCILFQTDNCDILITGDRSEKGEAVFLKRHDLPDLEVLIVGHHGAASSTGELLLSTLKPEYAVISVGENNAYGHPAEDVLNRLAQFGCVVYRTDRDGSVTLKGG